MTQNSKVRATTHDTAQTLEKSPHVYKIFKDSAVTKLRAEKNEFDMGEISDFCMATFPSTAIPILPSLVNELTVCFEAYARYQYGRSRFVGSKKSSTLESLRSIIATLKRLNEQMDALVNDGMRDFFRGERIDTVRLEVARDMHVYLVHWMRKNVGFSAAPALREQLEDQLRERLEDLIAPLPQLEKWDPGFEVESNPLKCQIKTAERWLAAIENGSRLLPIAAPGNKADPNLALFINDLANIFTGATAMSVTLNDARKRRVLRREFQAFLTACWLWLSQHPVEKYAVSRSDQPTVTTVLTIL